MREGIHPKYLKAQVICACGNTFETRSTHGGEIHIEICANCHPFFTGKQKIMDTAGRIERFKTRYAATPAKAEAKPEAPAAKPAPKKLEENRAAKRAKANASKPKPKAEAKPEAAAPAEAEPEAKA